jgi:hypothetical protein
MEFQFYPFLKKKFQLNYHFWNNYFHYSNLPKLFKFAEIHSNKNKIGNEFSFFFPEQPRGLRRKNSP